MGGLDQVPEDVLTVRGAQAQPAEQLDELRVHVAQPDRQHGVLTGPGAAGQHRLPGPLVDLLDARRRDAPVLDQLGQGQPPDLAAHRVEAAQQHRVGGVVDDEVDPGHLLVRPDVATLSADDPALHLVVGQLQDRHGRLRGLLTGDPLHGVGDDRPRPDLALLPGLRLEVAHDEGGATLGVVGDGLHHLLAGLLDGQSRCALQQRQPLGVGTGRVPGRGGAHGVGVVLRLRCCPGQDLAGLALRLRCRPGQDLAGLPVGVLAARGHRGLGGLHGRPARREPAALVLDLSRVPLPLDPHRGLALGHRGLPRLQVLLTQPGQLGVHGGGATEDRAGQQRAADEQGEQQDDGERQQDGGHEPYSASTATRSRAA